jgi:hypothetical protein
MSCSCFTSNAATPSVVDPDPTRHVNYTLGMVLGVDDFMQEHAYLSGRDEWTARDLIGYGTARGLRVGVEVDATKGPRVVVEPGAALSPRGRLICVPGAQCAYLNQWLDAHGQELVGQLGSPPPADVPLYVVLCYRECLTDEVPIPGEPCRSESELMAPSRLADDFCLELRFSPPNQREEDALRDFVAWLKRVDISDAAPDSTPLDKFLRAIRDAAQQWLAPASPLKSPPGDFMFGSPPAFLHVRLADAGEYMRAAFRLWVTELRPKWFDRWRGCAPGSFPTDKKDDEECVLLAEVGVPILQDGPGRWVVDDKQGVSVNENRRPYVVHLRMLQEWVLGTAEGAAFYEPGGKDVAVSDGGTGISTVPAAGQLLIGNGAGYTVGNLKGASANRVIVTPAAGAITLDLPQDINKTSSPTFAGLVTTASRQIKLTTLAGPNTTHLDGTHHCVICNTKTAAVNVVLPSTKQITGRVYIVKRAGANDCNLSCDAADTFEGKPTLTLSAANKLTGVCLVANEALTTWHILAIS